MKANGKLRRAATGHSENMVAQRFFEHVSPDGSTLADRVRAVHYLPTTASSWWLAENIAWGSGRLGSPAGVVRQWMHSPPHRANILSARGRDVGVGVAIGAPTGGPGATYTVDFGRVS